MADCLVLASGSGTNFEAIAVRLSRSPHRLLALVCDQPEAFAVTRAERLLVPTLRISYRDGRREAESRLERALVSLAPDLVVLAGFMRILPAAVVDRFPGRIVNVHPSLLPAFPGLHAIERSYADAGAPMGISVHLVDHGVDTGPLLARFEAERTGEPSLHEMEERIHTLEHRHYPRIVEEQLDAIDRARGTRGRT